MKSDKDSSNLEKDIAEAKKDYKKGNYITLQDLLAKEGYILKENKKIYDISYKMKK